MATHEDVQIQLVDTPPVTAEHVPPGFAGLWRSTDVVLVVADLASDTVLEDAEVCLNHLAERHIRLVDGPRALPEEPDDPLQVPGFVLGNKLDLPEARDNLELLRELLGEKVRIEVLSAHSPEELGRLPLMLFELLRVIRVYAKPPGKPPDLTDPFVLHYGADLHDLARKVYRGLEHNIKFARIWGAGVADGQQVHLDHVLQDKDVVELHA